MKVNPDPDTVQLTPQSPEIRRIGVGLARDVGAKGPVWGEGPKAQFIRAYELPEPSLM